MADPRDTSLASGGADEVEDWGDADFDLNDRGICIAHHAAKDVHGQYGDFDHETEAEDWDEEFEEGGGSMAGGEPELPADIGLDDENEEDKTDTIKLSSAAGSALKLVIEAQRSGQYGGTIVQLGTGPVLAFADEDDWDADLHIPDSLPFDLQALRQRKASFTSDLDGGEPSTSVSTTTSTSYKSNLGISTDFTDPESPPRKLPHKQLSGTSASDSSGRSSLLSPAYQFRGRGDAASLGQEADSEANIEHDFDLDPSLDKLSLSPVMSRQRSHSTLDQERLLWGEDVHARSPSPGPEGALSRSQSCSSNLGDNLEASSTRFGAESDADDEHEDPLDGLILEGSVFEMDTNAREQRPVARITETLEAILNVKRAGGPPEADLLKPHTDGPIESETDLAGGLVITDDLDLSPSRLSNNKLSYRTRHRGPLQTGWAQGRGHLSGHPPLPAPSSMPLSSSTLSHLWSTREPGSRMSQSSSLAVPTRSEIFSSHARLRTISQLSASTTTGHSSEIDTSHGHAAGRPRVLRGKGLQYKRSASDLHQKASDSPAPQHRTRNKGLARKRSLPSLADRFRQQGRPTSSGSTAGTANSGPRTPSSFSSRLTASTAASRARAAETAADIVARMAKESPPPPVPGSSALAVSRTVAFPSRSSARVRPSPADESSPSHRSRSPYPSRQGRVSPLVQYPPSTHFLRRTAAYGDGDELDAIEDLPSTSASAIRVRPERPARTASDESTSRSSRMIGRQQSKPGLIKPLGSSSTTQKTVRGMRWNPKALRWDGNEGALRDFDSVVQSSMRPALISQLTGSSTSSALASLSGYSSPVLQDSSSLITNIACGVKMVGDMIFDPLQMKWVHRNHEEDAEVFAQFEEELGSESGTAQLQRLDAQAASLRSFGSECGSEARSNAIKPNASWNGESTIRARKMRSGQLAGRLDERCSPSPSEASGLGRSPRQRSARLATAVEVAVAHAIKTGTIPHLDHVDESLWKACIEAEARHRAEMRSFLPRVAPQTTQKRDAVGSLEYSPSMDEIERHKPHLYHLQKLARGLGKGSGTMAPPSGGQ